MAVYVLDRRPARFDGPSSPLDAAGVPALAGESRPPRGGRPGGCSNRGGSKPRRQGRVACARRETARGRPENPLAGTLSRYLSSSDAGRVGALVCGLLCNVRDCHVASLHLYFGVQTSVGPIASLFGHCLVRESGGDRAL